MKSAVLTALLLALPVRAEDAPFGRDKMAHFAVGLSIGAGSHALAAIHLPRANPLVISIGLSIGVGGAKELLDLTGAGTPSWLDFGWTVFGGVVGALLSAGLQAAAR